MADKKLTVKLTEGQIEYLRALVYANDETRIDTRQNLVEIFNDTLSEARRVGN